MKEYDLVLASSSPRRKTLLGEAGAKFIVSVPGLDEEFHHDLSPEANVENIAMEKAEAVCKSYPGHPVLAADTIVVLGGKVIGKPTSQSDARRMLQSLSGKEHSVVTGVALAHLSKGLFWKSFAVSKVRFKELPATWIEEYVAGGEPMDKAGAYAIQGGAAEWIDSYSGSYTNIIGLPMEMVRQTLDGFGYEIFSSG
ncbi:MAG: Maf family protein [Nitrospinota bacterium]|nr:Maf family protein [Nitrospinota bacterium]